MRNIFFVVTVLLSGCAAIDRGPTIAIVIQHDADKPVTSLDPNASMGSRLVSLDATHDVFVRPEWRSDGIDFASGGTLTRVGTETRWKYIAYDLLLAIPSLTTSCWVDLFSDATYGPKLPEKDGRYALDLRISHASVQDLPKPTDGCDFINHDGAHGKWIDKERGLFTLDAVGRTK